VATGGATRVAATEDPPLFLTAEKEEEKSLFSELPLQYKITKLLLISLFQ